MTGGRSLLRSFNDGVTPIPGKNRCCVRAAAVCSSQCLYASHLLAPVTAHSVAMAFTSIPLPLFYYCTYSVVLPILSVRHAAVLYLNEGTYRPNLSHFLGGHYPSVSPNAVTKFQDNHLAAAINTSEWENLAIFDRNRRFFLGNGTPQARGYYQSVIGSHRYLIDRCRFQ